MEIGLQSNWRRQNMSRLKIVVPAALALGGFLICTTASYGKAEYTKKEKKSCITCHTKANSKELNEVGKCYDKSKSLDGCAKK
jgi:hypothetical protein